MGEGCLHDPAPLRTKRLDLRPLSAEDAEAFRDMTDEPAILAAVHFLAHPFTLEQARALLIGAGDARDCFWGVWCRAESTLIGTVGTHLSGPGEIEIGYWFGSRYGGRGFAGEAAGAIVMALGRVFPNRRVFAECRRDNCRSRRLLERLGFTATGEAGRRPGRCRFVLAAEYHTPAIPWPTKP